MTYIVVIFLATASADVLRQPTILKQSQDISSDGSYSYSYETENGIYHSENGTPVATDARSASIIVTSGQYQYTSPDGTSVRVAYVADHNGFQPQGEHIPAIPLLIQRALEYIRTHPPQLEQSNL
ncbi:hypothetical protein K0M31_012807 [Melipona bicolor]|uniref:Larval cuticle protein LCP-17 n=1 Tax=Melipona bicolor TaxID=60889 RepID=A0AA40FJ74_9HYME|nr:hypothetical protein K0M31_012807 [Melipona bicolor]